MTQRRIYQDEYPYFVTFRTKENSLIFEETKYAELLSKIMLNSGKLKGYNILSYQIMPDHAHLLTIKLSDRTLENVRSGGCSMVNKTSERTLSRVRSGNSKQQLDKSSKQYTISDLLQSIKGNFSRKIHSGNIWQKRFYTRIINNQEYLTTITEYIKQNPVKQKLPNKYHRLPYQFFNWREIKSLF